MSAGLPLAVQRVVLLGFGDFERNALMSYLRLSGTRVPAYEQVESVEQADFIIADADDAQALAAVVAAGRAGDTVAIGASAPDGALAWAMRPIDPMQVFRELDAVVALRHAGGPATVRELPHRLPAEAAGQAQATSSGSAGRRAGEAAPPPSALLVDDSDIALRFLQRQLHALGLRTETATNSARALELLEQQRFDIVFVDLDLGPASELDGLNLCQSIKRAPRGGDAAPAPPRVVIFSAHHSPTDRVRGTFAGCDDFLPKPLADEALQQTLRRFGLIPGLTPPRRRGLRDKMPTSGPVPLSAPMPLSPPAEPATPPSATGHDNRASDLPGA